MDLLPLITIPALYIIFALTKPRLQKLISFNICSICLAVSITWLILLTLWLMKMAVSPLPITILIGMSLAGIMYKLEDKFKSANLKNFWFVRLVIIVGGFYAVYLLLNNQKNLFLLIVIALIFLIAIPTFFFQGKQQESEKSKFTKRLDDCC